MKIIKNLNHFQTRTFYKCSACGESSIDRGEIQRHFAQHTITSEKIVYCNICGAGWYVDAYGEIGARKRAKACYEKHKEAKRQKARKLNKKPITKNLNYFQERTFYKCPVCGKNSTDRGEIQRHFAQHTITEEKIVYCNICGSGWYVDAYGEIGARKQAEACYEKHKEAGNIDEIAKRTFFSSGGDLGYI